MGQFVAHRCQRVSCEYPAPKSGNLQSDINAILTGPDPCRMMLAERLCCYILNSGNLRLTLWLFSWT
jgi:hypothetical protein